MSAATQKTYLAAIRDYADRVGIDPRRIPNNNRLNLDKRTFGKVDRGWSNRGLAEFKQIAKMYDLEKGSGPRMELILDIAKTFGC